MADINEYENELDYGEGDLDIVVPPSSNATKEVQGKESKNLKQACDTLASTASTRIAVSSEGFNISEQRSHLDEEKLLDDFAIRRACPPTQVSDDAVERVHRDLGLKKGEFSEKSILIVAVDGIKPQEVKWILAEYNPETVVSTGKQNSFVVSFSRRQIVSAMFVKMTKALRRVRVQMADEDGEVHDPEEELEEGQLQFELSQNDDVTLIDDNQEREVPSDVVEVNVGNVKIPAGRWRVVSAHVPVDRLVLVRFATHAEVTEATRQKTVNDAKIMATRGTPHDLGSDWAGEPDKIRPGLNVFNDKGEELEWDYEHDTRFYEDPKLEKEVEEMEVVAPEAVAEPSKPGIKVKGRGVRKGRGFANATGTLASDSIDAVKRFAPRRGRSNDSDEEIIRSSSRSRSPLSDRSPWKKGRLAGRLTNN